MKTHPVDAVTESIIGWVYSDTLVNLRPLRSELRRRVADDMAASGHRMSDAEVEQFVCGEHTEAESVRLRKLYPRTDLFLVRELT